MTWKHKDASGALYAPTRRDPATEAFASSSYCGTFSISTWPNMQPQMIERMLF
jgi:hypothetical protein